MFEDGHGGQGGVAWTTRVPAATQACRRRGAAHDQDRVQLKLVCQHHWHGCAMSSADRAAALEGALEVAQEKAVLFEQDVAVLSGALAETKAQAASAQLAKGKMQAELDAIAAEKQDADAYVDKLRQALKKVIGDLKVERAKTEQLEGEAKGASLASTPSRSKSPAPAAGQRAEQIFDFGFSSPISISGLLSSRPTPAKPSSSLATASALRGEQASASANAALQSELDAALAKAEATEEELASSKAAAKEEAAGLKAKMKKLFEEFKAQKSKLTKADQAASANKRKAGKLERELKKQASLVQSLQQENASESTSAAASAAAAETDGVQVAEKVAQLEAQAELDAAALEQRAAEVERLQEANGTLEAAANHAAKQARALVVEADTKALEVAAKASEAGAELAKQTAEVARLEAASRALGVAGNDAAANAEIMAAMETRLGELVEELQAKDTALAAKSAELDKIALQAEMKALQVCVNIFRACLCALQAMTMEWVCPHNLCHVLATTAGGPCTAVLLPWPCACF